MLLTGEPGIGKSRLIQAFRDQVRSDAVTVLRYFCSPFYVHSALHPILDQLERAANLEKRDPPEVKLDKLEAPRQGTDRVAWRPLCSPRCCRSLPASAIPISTLRRNARKRWRSKPCSSNWLAWRRSRC